MFGYLNPAKIMVHYAAAQQSSIPIELWWIFMICMIGILIERLNLKRFIHALSRLFLLQCIWDIWVIYTWAFLKLSQKIVILWGKINVPTLTWDDQSIMLDNTLTWFSCKWVEVVLQMIAETLGWGDGEDFQICTFGRIFSFLSLHENLCKKFLN